MSQSLSQRCILRTDTAVKIFQSDLNNREKSCGARKSYLEALLYNLFAHCQDSDWTVLPVGTEFVLPVQPLVWWTTHCHVYHLFRCCLKLVVCHLLQFDSCLCCGDFPGLSHTSDLNIGTLVATLPGTWHYSISAGTGWLSVSIL